MKKIVKSKDILATVKNMREDYVNQRDNIVSKFQPGDVRQENLYYKIELARANGRIDAINEIIGVIK